MNWIASIVSASVGVALWLCLFYVVWNYMIFPTRRRFLRLNLWAVPPLALAMTATGSALGIALWHVRSLFDQLPIVRELGPFGIAECVTLGGATTVVAMVLTLWIKRRRVLIGPAAEPRCKRCGYILRGVVERVHVIRCPECGYRNRKGEVLRRYRREMFARKMLRAMTTSFYIRDDELRKEAQDENPFADDQSQRDEHASEE